jgi:hypothetical protein
MSVRQAFDVAAIGEVTVDDGESLDRRRSRGSSAADTLGHRAFAAGATTTF